MLALLNGELVLAVLRTNGEQVLALSAQNKWRGRARLTKISIQPRSGELALASHKTIKKSYGELALRLASLLTITVTHATSITRIAGPADRETAQCAECTWSCSLGDMGTTLLWGQHAQITYGELVSEQMAVDC